MATIPSGITVKKLHGYKDLEIPFDSKYLILLAENGQGKTSVLNLIYGSLFSDTSRLSSINFEELIVKFADGSEYSIRSDDLEAMEPPLDTASRYLKRQLSTNQFDYAYSQLKLGIEPERVHRSLRINFNAVVSISALREAASEVKNHDTFDSQVNSTFAEIRTKFNCTPLYLPTYRRIEEDFGRLGLGDPAVQAKGINFGVQDVEKKLEEMRKAILASSNESFSRINGEILAKLINGFALTNEDIQEVRSLDRLDLVLERIGGNIKSYEKEQIERLFNTSQLFSERQYEPLVYFLSNMVKVYRQQKRYDVALREFTEKCNGYLVDQKLIYNESAVSVKAINKFTEEPVEISEMSSGEKQIISLFAKLFLDDVDGKSDENLAIFFDEPELSLSVEWQETLLPDVIASKKCYFLFAVTHSPFILKNVKSYARDMSAYITRMERKGL